jgi:hypothetical protein
MSSTLQKKEKKMNEEAQIDKRQHGQSLVELAVSLTFLLILVGGVIDLGRMFFTFITLRDAAQEGASYGSYACAQEGGIGNCIKGTTLVGQVKNRVRQSSQGNGSIVDLSSWPLNQIDVVFSDAGGTITDGSACAGDMVTVTVREPDFQITMPFIGTFVGQHIPIRATVSDTVLSPACP